MSRGHGAVQRATLALFTANPDEVLDCVQIAGRALGVQDVTHSQIVSFRRALGILVRKGRLANMGRQFGFGRRRYALPDRAAHSQDRAESAGVECIAENGGRPSVRRLHTEGDD
jgi:hypothetical protein